MQQEDSEHLHLPDYNKVENYAKKNAEFMASIIPDYEEILGDKIENRDLSLNDIGKINQISLQGTRSLAIKLAEILSKAHVIEVQYKKLQRDLTVRIANEKLSFGPYNNIDKKLTVAEKDALVRRMIDTIMENNGYENREVVKGELEILNRMDAQLTAQYRRLDLAKDVIRSTVKHG